MPLAELPKAFGIDELCKGFFPHLFNISKNYNYVGPLPDREFYSPMTMKPKIYDEFFRWYKNNSSSTFNFQDELLKYCINDVYVLRKCVMEFRKLFMAFTTVDPFRRSCTIASACNLVFRKLFLKPKTIGIVPSGGYRKMEKQSIVALKWLSWLNTTCDLDIQHRNNGGEKWVGRFKVDGIDKNGVVYEFYGCYWHGCEKCMTKRNCLTADQFTTAREAYERTMERHRSIISEGHQIVELWECQLKAMLDRDPEMKRYFNDLTFDEQLNPREGI
jgi:G:T-mismatch repair DNA endonuclease (very short patch repair protein)